MKLIFDKSIIIGSGLQLQGILYYSKSDFVAKQLDLLAGLLHFLSLLFMLTIYIPKSHIAERKYILSVVFCEFFGWDIKFVINDRRNTLITIDGDHRLLIKDALFITSPTIWLHPNSLPKQPLKNWNIDSVDLPATTVKSLIPVVYGDDPSSPNFFQQSESEIYLGLDIFGSAFFMLTRYEEIVKHDRDGHGRFPARASLAYQENFLDRPIINEYLEILWACLLKLWPRLKRKEDSFRVYLSHDVDRPFKYAYMNLSGITRNFGARTFKYKQPLQAFAGVTSWLQVQTKNMKVDPYNTFELIMDISEKNNLCSTFYFITDNTAGSIDAAYKIKQPPIRQLLDQIHQRGHKIGLHASYNTFQNPIQTKKEFCILRQACEGMGIQQKKWGGRQHYLRWETPTTFQNLEDAGLNYDTSLTFADRVGFRCGICYEYSTFNLLTKQPLKLKERPLIIMDATLLGKNYMNLHEDKDKAIGVIKKYKNLCRIFNGDFTLLWHNNNLVDFSDREIYIESL